MNNYPWWWERYHKPFPVEEQEFYEKHKHEITGLERTMNWETGERSITYSINKNKTTFKDIF